jgi:hypothetical protein
VPILYGLGNGWAASWPPGRLTLVTCGREHLLERPCACISSCHKFGFPALVTWMLLVGLFLGFGTDFVLEAAELAS